MAVGLVMVDGCDSFRITWGIFFDGGTRDGTRE